MTIAGRPQGECAVGRHRHRKLRKISGFGIAGSARVGGSARGPDPPGGATLGFGERFF